MPLSAIVNNTLHVAPTHPAAAISDTETALKALPALTPPGETQLHDAVTRLNQAMQSMSPGLEFSIDPESQRSVVRIIDQTTGDLIRQMPSAEALEIASALDKMQGVLISLRA
ncbi:Putative flagellar protein FlaG [Herminiimonas arsenicoxydans]|uniref:Flagellar protein FlaG n=1 Tax=Herminiimonas arsenicoxydans TaxID=204773 RepID=A4G681_HERAR|nr:Putative flagellar protein FlaG [Herminiimonas arsenicoxydans]